MPHEHYQNKRPHRSFHGSGDIKLSFNQNELEKRFDARKHVVDDAPGFKGFKLLRPTAGEQRYFVLTEWEDEESYVAWRDGDARKAHQGDPAEKPAPVATKAELLEFEVVLDSTS